MLNPDQPQPRLDLANKIRLGRSAYRADLRAMPPGDAAREIADVLETYALGLESDAVLFVRGMDAIKFLRCIRSIWTLQLQRLTDAAGCPAVLTRVGFHVKDLTPRQAFALADALRLAYPSSAVPATTKNTEPNHG